ncbi:hypothetical protein SAMN02799642_02836 [Methylobacterium brachiatum]|nr:hypothetical protein SAMN02799642_02836 [Methylobacterium brachiatum]
MMDDKPDDWPWPELVNDEPATGPHSPAEGSFETVSAWIRTGCRARRSGWAPGIYVRAVNSEDISNNEAPDVIHIWTYHTLPGGGVSLKPREWVEARSDILEMDWERILSRPEHEEIIEERRRESANGGFQFFRLNFRKGQSSEA